jgi:hypothetical protein
MNLLKQTVEEELIKNAELVDEVNEIFDINGYHQKGKKYGKYFLKFSICYWWLYFSICFSIKLFKANCTDRD